MLTYNFPAVKGIQAEREYYICMIPLKSLSKLFNTGDEDVAPEYRAQRKLNELIYYLKYISCTTRLLF